MDPEFRKSRVSMMALHRSQTKSLGNIPEPSRGGQMGRSMSRVRVRKQSYGFGGVPGIRPIERTSQMGRSMSRVRVRKQSYGFGGVPGIRPIERTSQLAIEFKRPPLVFLPTYQLDPFNPFHVAKTTEVIDALLDEHWTGHKYNAQESPALAMRLAGEIMRTIKTLNFDRYRIISVVTIAQKRSQSYNNCITFIWDHERDKYVNTQRETTTAFIQVTVFGVYLD